mgnify:CR=1 FL=1
MLPLLFLSNLENASLASLAITKDGYREIELGAVVFVHISIGAYYIHLYVYIKMHTGMYKIDSKTF